MDSTKSFVKVYNITPDVAEDFEFDFTVDSSDLLTELVLARVYALLRTLQVNWYA